MVQYADYDYYTNEYKGSMPKTDFERISKIVSMKIKANTFGRINENKVQDEVKFCTCLLADKLLKATKSEGKSSESVGSWSISYSNNAQTDIDKMVVSTIKECLSEVYTEDGTPLLYRGC